jgi:hypothetical protein
LCVRGANVVGCGLLVASMTEAEAKVWIGGYGTDTYVADLRVKMLGRVLVPFDPLL